MGTTLSKLTTDQIIVLKGAGMPVGEIARIAGITTGGVYSRIATSQRNRAWGCLQPPEPAPAAPAELGREGRIVYVVRGKDVYELAPGQRAKQYCRLVNWPKSSAARRCTTPRKAVERMELPKVSWRTGVKL